MSLAANGPGAETFFGTWKRHRRLAIQNPGLCDPSGLGVRTRWREQDLPAESVVLERTGGEVRLLQGHTSQGHLRVVRQGQAAAEKPGGGREAQNRLLAAGEADLVVAQQNLVGQGFVEPAALEDEFAIGKAQRRAAGI